MNRQKGAGSQGISQGRGQENPEEKPGRQGCAVRRHCFRQGALEKIPQDDQGGQADPSLVQENDQAVFHGQEIVPQ